VLRISTSSPAGLCVVGLRGRYNERGEFLITALPSVIEDVSLPRGELVLPQLVDGDGYSTQIVLFSVTADQTTAGVLSFFSQSGQPLNVVLR
jgi:hypothetical protein